MEATNQQRITIETFMRDAFIDFHDKLDAKTDEDRSIWRTCVARMWLPLHFLPLLLFIFLTPIFVCVRLAVAHADRVVFVLASALLSFYQVPRKLFYIYIAVVAFTGFLQILGYHSYVRDLFLHFLSWVSCGTSNMFLRKFTTLHFSNPFNRCFTTSKVIYVPMGVGIPSSGDIEVFDFQVSECLNFDTSVGSCRVKIETLVDNVTGSSRIRGLYVDAPWGDVRFVDNMENDNLGRLISYFNRVVETNCKELICTPLALSGGFKALDILGTINHFNSGLPLVKLECSSKKCI